MLSWNCRGAKSRQLLRNIKEMMRLYRPTIIVILESRISGFEADVVCRRIGRSTWVRSEARGFNGGIWFFWDSQDISIRVVHVERHFIHVLIHEKMDSLGNCQPFMKVQTVV